MQQERVEVGNARNIEPDFDKADKRMPVFLDLFALTRLGFRFLTTTIGNPKNCVKKFI